MTWILEEPVYILILGIVTLAFLGFALVQTGYRSLLHAILAVVALTAGMLFLERMVQTDREQIAAALEVIACDVESNNLQAILSHVYSEADGVRDRASIEFPQYTFRSVNIKDNVEVTMDANHSPPRAMVTFNVVVNVQRKADGFPYRRVARFVRVTLVFENGQWRVADYEHEQPIAGMQRREE